MSSHSGDSLPSDQSEIQSILSNGLTERCRDERYFGLLFEGTPDAILVLDDSARIVDANPAACRLIGLERCELIGRSVNETIETGVDFDSAWRKFKREGEYRGQRWLVRPDFARRLIEIRAKANVFPGQHLAIWRDITSRYFLDSQLLQRERDEALARLAGGVAHDLTNLLNVIVGHTELIVRQIAPGSESHKHGERILTAAQEAAALTAQLSAFGRQHVLAPAVLDLGALVHSCSRVLRSLVRENVQLSLPEKGIAANIRADRTQVAQVIFSLASAADELLPNGGKLAVDVKRTTLERALTRAGVRIPPSDYVVLEFCVRASGANAEACQSGNKDALRVAPPAVTRTLRQNNAFLWIETDFAAGTSLSAYFPPAVDCALGMPNLDSGKRLAGNETILIAEDDLALREATSEYLKGLGYRVLRAADGEYALQMANSVSCIDALVADLRMPRMGGEELAKKISVARPGVKILFVSGNIDSEFINRRSTPGSPMLLSKPFELRALACMLRDLLDGKER